MEQIKYHNCPECDGEGMQLRAELWPSGHREVWHDCEFCDGAGRFTEEEYIIMKLAGEV